MYRWNQDRLNDIYFEAQNVPDGIGVGVDLYIEGLTEYSVKVVKFRNGLTIRSHVCILLKNSSDNLYFTKIKRLEDL